MAVVLDSVERALTFIAGLNAGGELTEFTFGGELSLLSINVEGAKYHGSVPSELARGIWDFQEALYKAAAYALYGADDIRRLSPDQRDGLELVFCVQEGSTDLKAVAADFLKTLAQGITTMNDRTKAIVIVSVAVIVMGGTVAWKALDASAGTKKIEIESTLKSHDEDQRTEQLRIVASLSGQHAVVQRFEKASEDGTRALVRSASDATNLSVGRARFDRSNIEEVNQRAPRTASTANVIEGEFRVFGVESRYLDTTRYTLADKDGVEFPVSVNHAEFSADDLDRLWTAVKSRSLIKLEVSVTKNKGIIKAASLISVL